MIRSSKQTIPILKRVEDVMYKSRCCARAHFFTQTMTTTTTTQDDDDDRERDFERGRFIGLLCTVHYGSLSFSLQQTCAVLMN